MLMNIAILVLSLLSFQSICVLGQKDIVDTAIDKNFTKLVQALTVAGLVSSLKTPGPFTVFAPNDVAFDKLPSDVFVQLLKEENKDLLGKILQYHVTAANLTADEINKMALPANLTMQAGGTTTISKDGTTLKINGANVIATDVFATNGIIHTVDSVLLPSLDIVGTAITNGNFKTLVTLLKAADLVSTLQGSGPFTVFAPNDAAFNKLPPGTVDNLLKPENKEELTKILKYHVVGKRVTAADLKAMTLPTQVETLSGAKPIVDLNGDIVKINTATVIAADVENINGLIHVLDSVLLPLSDIVQTASQSAALTKLMQAITAADLNGTLKGDGPFTVFAPTNDAFDKLAPGVFEELIKAENKEPLSKILQYHVTNSLITAASVNRMSLPANVTMLVGQTVKVNKDGNTVQINDASVTTADLFTSNGMVHVIDTVLLPSVDVVTTATINGNFKTLVKALEAADLIGTLRGNGPFTVFAPTDAAFNKLPPGTVEDLLKPENKDKLTNILKYHVVGKRVSAADIKAMVLPAQVETLGGAKPIVDLNGDVVKVNTANVVTADVGSSNGLIHVLDTVLLPLSDIVQTAQNTSGFAKLVEAITAADLINTLKGTGPFTIFAPTDAAFEKLAPGVLDELIQPENKESLSKILRYHVTNQLFTASSIGRMNLPADVTMLIGGTTKLTKDGNTVKINGASITESDVFNANGMIHVIDTVLLPPLNLVETAITDGNFKTLVTALKAADLAGTLQGAGPFTVFAPSDAAFEKLPAGAVIDLLKPENKEKLVKTLKYHVVNGRRIASGDLKSGDRVTMFAGGDVEITRADNNVRVNEATVIATDVGTTNGVIHVIDTVLTPRAVSAMAKHSSEAFVIAFFSAILFVYRLVF